MYVEILYPEDNSIYMVAVYEKESDKRYTIDEIRKKDKFNGYYKEDNSILIYMKNQEPRISKYTKDYIHNLAAPDTMCNYIYQKINGKEYITVEWKTEDYIYGKKLYGYYVLEKIGGKFMEEFFEKKENIYTILDK